MDIPEKYQPIVADLLKQIIEFEASYGSLPKIQLVVSSEYAKLVQLAQKPQTSAQTKPINY